MVQGDRLKDWRPGLSVSHAVPIGRRIEEGCAFVPPRQFIRTSGGLEKAMLQRYDSGRELMKAGFACDSERHVQKDILLWSAMWLRCAGQTYS